VYSLSLNITLGHSTGRIASLRTRLLDRKDSKDSSTKIKARHRKDILDIHKAGTMEISIIRRGSKAIGSESLTLVVSFCCPLLSLPSSYHTISFLADHSVIYVGRLHTESTIWEDERA